MTILEEARAIQPYVCACRRTLHRWPETAMEEFKTTDYICARLDELAIPYRRTVPTGCIAEIRGGKPGKTVALRADIDALCIREINDLPFRSEREGYMHSCAHDTHAAMLLGAAKLLNERRDELCGAVRLLFQPAEENGTGARALIEQGALEGVSACFGEHIFGMQPAGTLLTTVGPMCPSVGTFRIHIHGVSCHGAMPHMGADATVCAAALVMELQTIVSRELSPLVPAVVTVGQLHSGSAYNICSGEAELEGTVRLFDEELHAGMPDILRRIMEDTAHAHRCTAELDYEFGSPSLATDETVTQIARRAALKLLDSPEQLGKWEGSMGGEDFSYYTHRVPSAFFSLGCGGTVGNHNEHFLVDESVFPLGVALHVQFALDYLNGAE